MFGIQSVRVAQPRPAAVSRDGPALADPRGL